jgi:hypothetical protein
MLQFTVKQRPLSNPLAIATLQHGEVRLGRVPDGDEVIEILAFIR